MYNQSLPTQASIRIIGLEMLETGTYNPMFARPFEMNVSGECLNNISNRVAQTNGQPVSASLLSGVAASIMRPTSTAQHEIPIHLGWAERRLRFRLTVEVISRQGSPYQFIFQGFTSHLGVGHNGSFDPRMEFIINSFIRVNNSVVSTPYGLQEQSVVTQSAHILNGQIIQDPHAQDVYGMRPSDIYTGIQSNYLEQGYKGYHQEQETLIDTRIGMHGESLVSRRTNCLPTNFLAKVIGDYQQATALAEYGQGNDDLMGRARHLSQEQTAPENPFIRALGNVRGIPNQTSFTIDNLLAIDPNSANVMNYRTLGNAVSNVLHQSGQTAYWNGRDNETIWAGLLANAVPAVMMELMIGQISFTSTNDAAGGHYVTMIGDIKGLSNLDMSRNMGIFIAKIEREILQDLAYEGHLFYLSMSCNIYGESTIDIKLDVGPTIRYVTPSFSDGLFAPLYTSNKGTFTQMVNDFEVLMNDLPGSATSMAVNMAV